MHAENEQAFQVISQGKLVLLRGRSESDRLYIKRWLRQGEWLLFDAPWEEIPDEEKSAGDQIAKTSAQKDGIEFEHRAIIATLDNIPLGWVNRYGEKSNPDIWYVGIDICEDAYLNRGYGTEALGLWIDHLFSDEAVHKICLDTWSFNPRMVRVAERIGFKGEGRQREMRYWQGEWHDLLHFGMLREEWESGR